MFRQIGPLEIVLILSVLLLLFGAKRLPELGKSVGKSLREFKGATKGLADDVKDGIDEDDEESSSEVEAPKAEASEPKAEASKPKAKARAKDAAE